MSGISKRLGAPPRPPRPHFSTTMGDQLGRRLQLVAAELGCLAIDATALWTENGVDFLGTAEVGAAAGDVQKLRRLARKVVP